MDVAHVTGEYRRVDGPPVALAAATKDDSVGKSPLFKARPLASTGEAVAKSGSGALCVTTADLALQK